MRLRWQPERPFAQARSTMQPGLRLDFDLNCGREQSLAVIFNRVGVPIAEYRQTSPYRDRVDFDFRRIFGLALRHDGYALAIAHSHPSGDPKPSRADIQTTRTVARLCADLDIHLADHIIVARGGRFSFREQGLI